MRTFSIAALLTIFGLLVSVTLVSEPIANALAQVQEID
jgi:hypothetical protein